MNGIKMENFLQFFQKYIDKNNRILYNSVIRTRNNELSENYEFWFMEGGESNGNWRDRMPNPSFHDNSFPAGGTSI